MGVVRSPAAAQVRAGDARAFLCGIVVWWAGAGLATRHQSVFVLALLPVGGVTMHAYVGIEAAVAGRSRWDYVRGVPGRGVVLTVRDQAALMLFDLFRPRWWATVVLATRWPGPPAWALVSAAHAAIVVTLASLL